MVFTPDILVFLGVDLVLDIRLFLKIFWNIYPTWRSLESKSCGKECPPNLTFSGFWMKTLWQVCPPDLTFSGFWMKTLWQRLSTLPDILWFLNEDLVAKSVHLTWRSLVSECRSCRKGCLQNLTFSWKQILWKVCPPYLTFSCFWM